MTSPVGFVRSIEIPLEFSQRLFTKQSRLPSNFFPGISNFLESYRDRTICLEIACVTKLAPKATVGHGLGEKMILGDEKKYDDVTIITKVCLLVANVCTFSYTRASRFDWSLDEQILFFIIL